MLQMMTIVVKAKVFTMSSKSKKRRPERVSMTKAVTAAEIMFVWAWMDVFHPSPDDVQKLKESLHNVAESVALGNLNIREIRDAIRDEHGWEIK